MVQPVDVEPGDVHIGPASGDPVRQHAAQPATRQDAHRIQPSGDEVVAQLGCLSHDGGEVGGEALGPAEERADARVGSDGHAAHRSLDVRPHAIPIGLQRRERDIVGDATHVPRSAHGFEQSDHQPADFLAVVPVVGRIFDDGP